MHVLMFSTDAQLLDRGSRVYARTKRYAEKTDSLLVILVGAGSSYDVTDGPLRVVRFGATNKLFAFASIWQKCIQSARDARVSVVTSQDPFWCGLLGVRVARALRIPVQVQIHTDFMNPAFLAQSLMNRLALLIARYVLPRASCVRIVSERMRASVLRFTRAPVSVLPIAIDGFDDIVTERPPEFGSHPVILMVCRLVEEKNVSYAIRALAHVPDAHLYIVGDGHLRKSLQLLAPSLQLKSRVHFLGWKTDVRPYYAHADCFLSLSSFEGYGLSIAEAALNGCPVIATNAGIAGWELASDEHVTMTVIDQYEIGMAIRSVLDNKERSQARAHRAQDALTKTLLAPDDYAEEYVRHLAICGR